jgi:hypothetical protein
MALASRHEIILDAVAATLNRDADLASRDFRVRKKAYNRGNTWLPGAWVTPEDVSSPRFDNATDEGVFGVWITVVDPTDADLTDGLAEHLAAIERVEDIFRSKSSGHMPLAFQSAITNSTAGTAMTALSVDVVPGKRFVTQAFEVGFDASSCVLKVRVRVPRRDVRSL